MSKNRKYYITRHARSCNNDASLIHKGYEPQLTDYALEKTPQHGRTHTHFSQHDLDGKPLTVYVSCLARTWETAILLYAHMKKLLNLS